MALRRRRRCRGGRSACCALLTGRGERMGPVPAAASGAARRLIRRMPASSGKWPNRRRRRGGLARPGAIFARLLHASRRLVKAPLKASRAGMRRLLGRADRRRLFGSELVLLSASVAGRRAGRG